MLRHASKKSSALRMLAVLLVGASLLAALWTARLDYRYYRSAYSLIEPAPPSPVLRHPERTGVAGLANVYFESRAGLRVAGWYAPSVNHAAVIMTHGTNTDRSSMLSDLRLLADAGYGVLAFDWPGLGESQGKILWGSDARQSLTAAIDWLAANGHVDPQRIGALGFSMGGFVMAQVAAGDARLRAVVLEGTPTSIDAYIEFHYGLLGFVSEWPAFWALRHAGLRVREFSPDNVVASISPRPLFMIGGTRDDEIPSSMVRALYAAARAPKALWVVPGAGHGGYSAAAPAEYEERLLRFFQDNLLTSPGMAVRTGTLREPQYLRSEP